jgi:hypothetical protein
MEVIPPDRAAASSKAAPGPPRPGGFLGRRNSRESPQEG